MPANLHSNPHPEVKELCRTGCSGYGTRQCCPPLLVMAMRSHPLPSQPCHEEHLEAVEAVPAGYFGERLASGEYCGCLLSHWGAEAVDRMQM